MNSEPLLEEVRRIIRDLEQARTEVSGDITRGLEIGQQLRDACREISNGSSDSWIGWHSRMYYGNFEQPPVHLSWDAEWGGLNAVADAAIIVGGAIAVAALYGLLVDRSHALRALAAAGGAAGAIAAVDQLLAHR